MELGYFEEQKLQVSIIRPDAQAYGGALDVLMTGNADVALGDLADILSVAAVKGQSDSLKIIGELTTASGEFLLTRQAADFKFSKLADKSIVLDNVAGFSAAQFNYILAKQGIYPGKDLRIIEDSASLYLAGTADYLAALPEAAAEVVQSGEGNIATALAAYSGKAPSVLLIAPTGGVNRGRAHYAGFLRAIAKALQYLKSHTAAEVAGVLAKSFPEMDKAYLTEVIAAYQKNGVFPEDTVVSESGFKVARHILEDTAGKVGEGGFEDMVENISK
jgi:NitT/TauT family transport system substrate-binding protein